MSDKERKILNTLKDVACGHYSPEEGTELIINDFAVECRAPAPQPAEETDYYWKDGSLKWGHPVNVEHLILQLQMLDPTMKVSSVHHVPLKEGNKARAFGLSMSRERWNEAGWLDWRLSGPECLAIWAQPNEHVEGTNSELAATPQVTPCFPDCNVGTAHECCVARMKRLEKEQYGQIWEGTSEQAPQVTPTLKEILKQYGAHHIRDCDALNKWKELPCNCGFAALIEGTPEASSAKCRSPYHRPTAMFCLDCIPPNAPLSVLLLSNRQPTEEETKRGLDIAKAKGTK